MNYQVSDNKLLYTTLKNIGKNINTLEKYINNPTKYYFDNNDINVNKLALTLTFPFIFIISSSYDGKYQSFPVIRSKLTNTTIYYSSDYGITWNYTDLNFNTVVIFMNSNGNVQLCGQNNGFNIYISRDYGQTWNLFKTLDSNFNLLNISGDGNTIAISDKNNNFYISYNQGNSWTVLNSISISDYIKISYNGDKIYNLNSSLNVYNKNNNNFVSIFDFSLIPIMTIFDINSTGQYITLITSSNSVYISNDFGNTFKNISFIQDTGKKTISMNETGQYQMINIINGIYISKDYGNTWNLLNFNFEFPFFLPISCMSKNGSILSIFNTNYNITNLYQIVNY
jgi:hypothetical protein